jgi:Na+/melibiose symporter-like transporter
VLTGVRVPAPRSDPETPHRRSSVWSALRDRAFRALVLSQTLLSLAWLIPTVAFPVYLVTVLGLPAFWPTLVVAARYAGISVLQLPLTRLTASWNRSTVLTAAIALVAGAVALTATIGALPTAAQGIAAVAVALLLSRSPS